MFFGGIRISVGMLRVGRLGDNRCDSRIGRCDGEDMVTAER